MKFSEGDRVCCVARDGARTAGKHGGAIYIGGIYQAKRRQSDGVLTWRRAGSFYGTRSGFGPSKKFVAELMAAAQHPWLEVRHGQAVPV